MRTVLAALVVHSFFLAFSASVLADDPSGGFLAPVDCDQTTQVEINRCTNRVLHDSDAALNELYANLMHNADETEKRELQRMQRAWIELRDSQCALFVHYHTGAANLSAWDTFCRASMTATRVAELGKLGTGILWNARKHDKK